MSSRAAREQTALIEAARAVKAGDFPEAETLLRNAIAAAPASALAYADLASLLCRLERRDEAIALLDQAIAANAGIIWPLSIKAAVLSAERLAEDAVQAHAAVVARAPQATIPWTNYAHALQTVGRTDEAMEAYRRAIALNPGNGSAWLGLANLRAIRFDAADAARMEHALQGVPEPFQQIQLQFALGKALGDLGDYAGSFRYYEAANRLRGSLVPYDSASTRNLVGASEAIFTRDFFDQRQGQGHDGKGMIFIVGMPRSGSTLIEQILASHPMIEGTGELFELRDIAARLVGNDATDAALPEAIARLGADALRALGENYLRSTRRHRRTDRPFFTDKLPSNWQLTPLIRLILPNAKIIDVRRDPVACCFSSFTTYFNRETSFPANMADLSSYYADYVRMMAHMDTISPAHVHCVHHENVVENLESEVRRLLDFLGISFDPACLHFQETRRPIHTPSAQQVRRPINREGLDRWRNYARWLTPITTKFDQP